MGDKSKISSTEELGGDPFGDPRDIVQGFCFVDRGRLRAKVCIAPVDGGRFPTYWLFGLEVNPGERRRGHATALMRRAMDWADLAGAVLHLEPSPFDDAPMSKEDLCEWYKRLGFNVIPDGTKYRAGFLVMERGPNPLKPEA